MVSSVIIVQGFEQDFFLGCLVQRLILHHKGARLIGYYVWPSKLVWLLTKLKYLSRVSTFSHATAFLHLRVEKTLSFGAAPAYLHRDLSDSLNNHSSFQGDVSCIIA